MSSYIQEEEVDEVISELRMLKVNMTDFGPNYLEYCEQRREEMLFNKAERIDKIWAPIIRNPKYQVLGKFLKSVLSFIHSTAFAEGSIKDIRNVVGSNSHNTSDTNCQARLALISAVRSTDSCCFDYNKNSEEHRRNWQSSWKKKEFENESGNESAVQMTVKKTEKKVEKIVKLKQAM